MLSSLSATEVAFLMAAVVQLVAAGVWAAGAWAVPEARRAAAHWSVYAALSAFTWTSLAMRLESPPLIGILAGVLAASVLQRGIRIFIDRPPRIGLPLALLAAVIVAHLALVQPAWRHLQVLVNFGALALIYLGTARDLYGHARDDLRFRWPLLLALPVLLGALGYGSRAVQALVMPDSVLTDMATHSTLNVGSALAFVVLVLTLHATLMTLLVARLVRQLQRLSRHDGLTGLLNRRAIQGALEEQHERSQRAGEPFAVMMIDLDHFKSVNDRFGHAMGDQALKAASALLHRRLADQGWVGRFGGEEFMALLPGYRLDKAVEMAEELRVALSAERPAQLPPDLPLSVSIGVAQWRGPDEDLTRLLLRADEAMYEAKRRGRDRVVAADQ